MEAQKPKAAPPESLDLTHLPDPAPLARERLWLTTAVRAHRFISEHPYSTLLAVGLFGGVLPPILDGVRGSADVPSHLFIRLASALVVLGTAVFSVGWSAAFLDARGRILPKQAYREAVRILETHRPKLGALSSEARVEIVFRSAAVVGVLATLLASITTLLSTVGLFSPDALGVFRLLGGLAVFVSAVLLLALKSRRKRSQTKVRVGDW